MGYEMDKYTSKKKEIIDVIVSLMDEDGLKKISIKEICEAANISIGSFYHYFKSKDLIIEDMYMLMDEFFLVNESKIKGHSKVSEQIIDFVNHFGLYVEEWGYYANLLIMRSSVQDIEQSKFLNRNIYIILQSIIEEGKNNKEFRFNIDTDEFVTMIFVIIRGYLLEWAKRDHDFPVREKMVTQTRYLMSYLCN